MSSVPRACSVISSPTEHPCSRHIDKGFCALAAHAVYSTALYCMDENAETKHTEPPPRKCDKCGSPMQLMSTLPALGPFPMRRFFKCTACHFVVAETGDGHDRDLIATGAQLKAPWRRPG